MPATLEPSEELQKRVERHLRDSLTLRAVMRAEKESLSRIVEALQSIPEELHAALVGVCVQRVARKYVAEP